MVTGVCPNTEHNKIDILNVKVIERLSIDLSRTLRLFIEIEPSKLAQGIKPALAVDRAVELSVHHFNRLAIHL